MMRARFWSKLLTAFALALAPIAAAFAEPITGRATVVDGDTLEIRGECIRLQGVDAPEGKQLCRGGDCQIYRCGQQAANALAEHIGADPISCEPSDIDQYGRTVAVCRLGALDFNGWLVEEGFALACRRYSTAYVRQEAAARLAWRGIWAGVFAEPWEWPRQMRSDPVRRKGDGRPPQMEACQSSMIQASAARP